VTAEGLSEIYFTLLKDYHGDALDYDDLSRVTWARIPHFFSTPYYVYQYATCFASSAQLMKQLTGGSDADRPAAIGRYLTLLKSGGSDHPMTLLQKAGVDLGQPETVRAVIDQLDGPVVLVGHSYGGAVITVAGTSDKVAGLVYVAGVVPDEGESVNDLQGRFPSLAMGPLVQPVSLPDGSVELSIDPARFPDVFGADLPAADAAFRAISQRSIAATAFDDRATAAAWRATPSWAVFGTADHPVAPELQRFAYDRAGSTVTEVEGASHLLMMSQPDIVAGVIREAVLASAVSRAA